MIKTLDGSSWLQNSGARSHTTEQRPGTRGGSGTERTSPGPTWARRASGSETSETENFLKGSIPPFIGIGVSWLY